MSERTAASGLLSRAGGIPGGGAAPASSEPAGHGGRAGLIESPGRMSPGPSPQWQAGEPISRLCTRWSAGHRTCTRHVPASPGGRPRPSLCCDPAPRGSAQAQTAGACGLRGYPQAPQGHFPPQWPNAQVLPACGLRACRNLQEARVCPGARRPSSPSTRAPSTPVSEGTSHVATHTTHFLNGVSDPETWRWPD